MPTKTLTKIFSIGLIALVMLSSFGSKMAVSAQSARTNEPAGTNESNKKDQPGATSDQNKSESGGSTTTPSVDQGSGGQQGGGNIAPSVGSPFDTDSGVNNAFSGDNITCDPKVQKFKWYSPILPGTLLPLIPPECASNGDQVKALSPALLPLFFLKTYIFLVSFMFYLILPATIYAGLKWTWAGLFGEGEIAEAKKLFGRMFSGLILVSIFYLVVMLILGFVGFNIADVSLESFFSFD